MSSVNFQELSNFIWSIADLLRGPYRQPQYERVMLPLTVLRRFDCLLEPTKAEVLKRFHSLEGGKVTNIDPILNKVAGGGVDLGFHNRGSARRSADHHHHVAEVPVCYSAVVEAGRGAG